MLDCRLDAGRLFAQHTNDKIGSFEVVRFDLKKLCGCAQRRFGCDLLQRIKPMVLCAIRFRTFRFVCDLCPRFDVLSLS